MVNQYGFQVKVIFFTTEVLFADYEILTLKTKSGIFKLPKYKIRIWTKTGAYMNINCNFEKFSFLIRMLCEKPLV